MISAVSLDALINMLEHSSWTATVRVIGYISGPDHNRSLFKYAECHASL